MSPSEIASLALSFLISTVVGLLKYSESQRAALIDRRLSDHETHAKDLENKLQTEEFRIRALELQAEKFAGELKLLLQSHEHLGDTLEEIKAEIVPRSEWEHRMTSLEKGLSQIQAGLASLIGRSNIKPSIPPGER